MEFAEVALADKTARHEMRRDEVKDSGRDGRANRSDGVRFPFSGSRREVTPLGAGRRPSPAVERGTRGSAEDGRDARASACPRAGGRSEHCRLDDGSEGPWERPGDYQAAGSAGLAMR